VLAHLDTDLGGDPDDVAALAMLARWPGMTLTGITTNLDAGGERAGLARYVLDLLDLGDVPVTAGSSASTTSGRTYRATAANRRYWPADIPAEPGPIGAALDLLATSASAGATVVAIGAWSNLALLERDRPGALDGVPVVGLGGWFRPPAPDLPAWDDSTDFNIQVDVGAAETVLSSGADLTLVPMPELFRAHLRASDLPRLDEAGTVGQLLARQARAYAPDRGRDVLARSTPGLPDDLVNFHWDPATVAVAVGWDGAEVRECRIRWERDGELLHLLDDPAGRPVHVVDRFDGPAFSARWLDLVTRG
jgi:purine nucleosidase